MNTVLVVDDHSLVRTGVVKIISHEPDLEVVAEAANGAEAVEAFAKYRPDVTLLDLRMPVMEGVEAVRQIRALDPQARVIVLTTYDTDEDITRALKAGAKAYALKSLRRRAERGALRRARDVHPRRAGRQDLSRSRCRGHPGRGDGAHAGHAARAGHAPPHGRRQEQQGDRHRPRHQRTYRQIAPRPPLRKTRRHEQNRGGESGHATRPRAYGLRRIVLSYRVTCSLPYDVLRPRKRHHDDVDLIAFMALFLMAFVVIGKEPESGD